MAPNAAHRHPMLDLPARVAKRRFVPWATAVLALILFCGPANSQGIGIDRPETLAPDVRAALAEFMAQGNAGYFAVSRDGQRFGLATCPRDPFCRREFAVSAFGACRAAGADECLIYASKRRTGSRGFGQLAARDLPGAPAIAETLSAPAAERAGSLPAPTERAETVTLPVTRPALGTQSANITIAGAQPRTGPALDLARSVVAESDTVGTGVVEQARDAAAATPERSFDFAGNPDASQERAAAGAFTSGPGAPGRTPQIALAPGPPATELSAPANASPPGSGAPPRVGSLSPASRVTAGRAPNTPDQEPKTGGAAGQLSPEVIEAFRNFQASGVQAVFAVSDDGQTWGVALCRDARRCDFADTLNAIQDCLESGAESCAVLAYQDPTTDLRPAAPVGGS